jgi:hypothetical protein
VVTLFFNARDPLEEKLFVTETTVEGNQCQVACFHERLIRLILDRSLPLGNS